MRIRSRSSNQRRVPRKHKKRFFGTRNHRTETQKIRYRLDFLKFKKQYNPHPEIDLSDLDCVAEIYLIETSEKPDSPISFSSMRTPYLFIDESPLHPSISKL